MFNFIKQVFLIALVSDQARLTVLALPRIGEEYVFELPDLNLPYQDESPLQSFYSTENSHFDGLDPVLKQAMLHCEEIPHSSPSTTQDYSASSLKRKSSNLDTNLAAKDARIVEKRPKAISNDRKPDKPRDNGEIVEQHFTSNYPGDLNIHHTPIENLKDALSPQSTRNLLEPSDDVYRISNVNDWNFLKKATHKSGNNDLGDYQKTKTDWMFDFVKRLNSKEEYSPKEKEFSNIAGKKAALILKMFDKCKKNFAYPSGMQRNIRQGIILKNILWISREKLHLGRFRNTYEEISTELVNSLKSRMHNSSKKLLQLDKKTSQIMEYVAKINIITTSLAILYLALFQEHAEGELKKEFILGLLDFLKDFWKDIVKGNHKDLKVRNFAQHLHHLLNLEDADEMARRNVPQCIMTVSWNIIGYWSEKKYAKLKVSGSKEYGQSMTEIINKIIFFSDYQ
jgi:hypothetical protein